MVVAAGNEGRNDTFKTQGYGTIMAPGNSPAAITVGAYNTKGTASDSDDVMTSFSSKGPSAIDFVAKPDLVAPGAAIVSTRPWLTWFDQKYATNRVPKKSYCPTCSEPSSSTLDYFQMSGTSMATPFVSGAAVLLLQQQSSLTPDQVKARLMKTASKLYPATSTVIDSTSSKSYTVYSDLFTVGAGYLDTAAALANTDVAPSTLTARSPAARVNSSGFVELVFGSNMVWGTNLVWGNNLVWGYNIVWGTNLVWGYNLVWGTQSATGYNIVWGTTSPWSASNTAVESLSVLVDAEN